MMPAGASSPPIASMAMRKSLAASYQLPAASFPSQSVPSREKSERIGWKLEAGSWKLCFFDFPDLTAVVIAALLAHLMRRLGLLALRAGPGGHRLERVVRAALRG